jgi:hypothetical protein
VVDDDAVVVVDQLGLVAELDRLAERPRTIGRASRSCRLTTRRAASGITPASRDRAWPATTAVTCRVAASSVTARRSCPARRPAAVRRPRRALRSTARASRALASASPARAAVASATTRWASSLAWAPRSRSFEAICRARRPAAREWSGQRVRVAPPAALTRVTTRPILTTALANSPASVG